MYTVKLSGYRRKDDELIHTFTVDFFMREWAMGFFLEQAFPASTVLRWTATFTTRNGNQLIAYTRGM